MAPEKHGESAASGKAGPQTTFVAEVNVDPAIETTVITLSYNPPDDPAHYITISIAPELGSNLFRFRVGEHDLLHCDVELLKRKGFTGCFVLWPIPNRLRDLHYEYQGHSYSFAGLQRVPGDRHLVHGLVYDQEWQFETPRVSDDAVSVTTYIDFTPATPWYQSYPFESRLTLTYTLRSNGVTVDYAVKNNSSSSLPFGFALHPYFSAIAGRQQCYVSLPAEEVMEADKELLPTGRLLNFDGVMYAMFDLRQPRQLDPLNLDHVYTKIEQAKSSTIDFKAAGVQLHANTSNEFTHIVIYVPPGQPFFCVENQTCSTDALNLARRGMAEMAHLLEVSPGETSTGFIQYALEYRQ